MAVVMHAHRFDVHVQRRGVEMLAKRLTRRKRNSGGDQGDEDWSPEVGEANRAVIDALLTPMQDFPLNQGLQRWGCVGLAALLDARSRHDSGVVSAIVASGGVPALLSAMELMQHDQDVQTAGCGVLGNAQLFDPRIVRLKGKASTNAVIAALEALPTCERIVGLGSLAMANLLYKDDANVQVVLDQGGAGHVVAGMRRFPESAQVQAAGAWAIAAIGSKDDALRDTAREVGAEDACHLALRLHSQSPAVVRNAELALAALCGQRQGNFDGTNAADADDQCSVM